MVYVFLLFLVFLNIVEFAFYYFFIVFFFFLSFFILYWKSNFKLNSNYLDLINFLKNIKHLLFSYLHAIYFLGSFLKTKVLTYFKYCTFFYFKWTPIFKKNSYFSLFTLNKYNYIQKSSKNIKNEFMRNKF